MDETAMNIAEQNIRIIRLRAQLAAKHQQQKLTRLTAQADALEAELNHMNTESLGATTVEVPVPVAADYDVPRGRRVKVSANVDGHGQY